MTFYNYKYKYLSVNMNRNQHVFSRALYQTVHCLKMLTLFFLCLYVYVFILGNIYSDLLLKQ